MARRKNTKRIDPRYFLHETAFLDKVERLQQKYGVRVMVSDSEGRYGVSANKPPRLLYTQCVLYCTVHDALGTVHTRVQHYCRLIDSPTPESSRDHAPAGLPESCTATVVRRSLSKQ